MKHITLNQSPQLIKKIVLQISFLILCFNSYGQLSTYSFTASTDTVEDMSIGTTNLLGPFSDDNISGIINIGFTFIFDATSYTQFSVSSNGLLRFGSRFITIDSTNVLTASTNIPRIVPYWDNLHTGTNGKVHYKLIGTAPNRKLCVEWFETVPKSFDNPANAKFQAWLYESTNVIKFVYGDRTALTGIPVNSRKYSTGLAHSTTDYRAVTVSNNTSSSSITNDTNTVAIDYQNSFVFSPPTVATSTPTCLTVKSPANGASLVSTNVLLTWSGVLTPTGSPSGYDVYFGTSSNPPLVSTNQAATNYNPGTLSGNTKYYWKVNPRNAFGIASCAKDSFTTFVPVSYEVERTTNDPGTSISSTGNIVTSWRNSINTDDNLSNSVPIGFNFTYQGIARTNVLISLNGFITFNTSAAGSGGGSGSYSPANQSFSLDGATGSPLTVAPFYEDLLCQGNNLTQASLDTSVKYLTSGTVGSRVFTIQWSDMEIYNNTGPDLTFQVKLFEGSNNIEFVYLKMDGFNGTNNYSYTYTSGVNASTISFPPGLQELITQQIANTRSFGNTPTNSLSLVPECDSKILFTPGNYAPFVPPPVSHPNDNPEGATVLPFNNELCVDICGTIYSSAGNTASSIPVCAGNADDDIWFTFTTTDTGSVTGVTVKVLSSGGYDAVVELLDSSYNSISCKNSTTMGQIETIRSTIPVGNKYYVRVYHSGVLSGPNGAFSICVSRTPPAPDNDDCAGAVNIPVTPELSFMNGTNTIAATETVVSGLQPCNSTNADDDVWYYFVTPGLDVTIHVQSEGTFNAAVQVFSGSCASLTSLQCANQTSTGGHETVTLTNLNNFTTYWMRVYHASAGAAGGGHTVGITSPVPGCPTVFNPPNATSGVDAAGSFLSWNPVYNATGYDVYLDLEKPPDSVLVLNTPDTSAWTDSLIYESGTTYSWRVIPRNYMGAAVGCPINLFAPTQADIGLFLKVFIDGYYIGNQTMAAYQDPNFPPDLTDTIPDLTDTIFVSLADSAPPHDIAWRSPALLYSNGSAYAKFPGQFFGQYFYVVINHRNIIETWTKLFYYDLSDTLLDLSVSIESGLKDSPAMPGPPFSHNSLSSEKATGLKNASSLEDLLPYYFLRNEDEREQFENAESRLSRLLFY